MKSLFSILMVLTLIVNSHFCFAKDTKLLSWKTMRNLDFQTGEMSDLLKKNINQTVEITGFIVPLEMSGNIDEIKEFLLVPDPLSCIHVPPPPPNQIVLVNMKKSVQLDMDYRGIIIRGVLNVYKTDGVFSFKLAGISTRAVEFDDEYEYPIDNEYPLMDTVDD